ncbi:MAG: hypothetical protein QXN66_03790 [Thermoplasmatales archaeon]
MGGWKREIKKEERKQMKEAEKKARRKDLENAFIKAEKRKKT